MNTARDFVCQALLSLISGQNTEGKTPIAHLLLEAVPPDDGSPGTSHKAAAHLFGVCCCAERARLAVKVCKHCSIGIALVPVVLGGRESPALCSRSPKFSRSSWQMWRTSGSADDSCRVCCRTKLCSHLL